MDGESNGDGRDSRRFFVKRQLAPYTNLDVVIMVQLSLSLFLSLCLSLCTIVR